MGIFSLNKSVPETSVHMPDSWIFYTDSANNQHNVFLFLYIIWCKINKKGQTEIDLNKTSETAYSQKSYYFKLYLQTVSFLKDSLH